MFGGSETSQDGKPASPLDRGIFPMDKSSLNILFGIFSAEQESNEVGL